MGWTDPRTWGIGELANKAIMDAHIKDNLDYLKAHFAFDTTEVFSDTAPTDWTDLDLASVVGSNQAIVLLKVTVGATGIAGIGFRKNGEPRELGAPTFAQGIAMVYLGVDTMGYVIMVTDASGIVEWKGAAAQAVTIDMEAYWK